MLIFDAELLIFEIKGRRRRTFSDLWAFLFSIRQLEAFGSTSFPFLRKH